MLIAILLVGTMFAVSDAFVESETYVKRGIFIAGAVCLSLLAALSKRFCIKANNLLCIVCIGIMYFTIRTQISPMNSSSVELINILAFALLYLYFCQMRPCNQSFFCNMVILVCLAQGIMGIMQYCGLIHGRSTFSVVGSFENPAGYAACLAVGFPYCLRRLPIRRTFEWWLMLCSRVVVPIAIIASDSRAGILAIAVVSVLYLCSRYTHIRKSVVVAMCIGLLTMLIALFLLKIDSSLGRMQIWQVCIMMLLKNPMFGGGAGFFLSQYMIFQGNALSADSGCYWPFLADNVIHPFNEYLYVAVQYGAIGVILVIISMFFLLKNKRWATVQGLCVLSLAVFACFSYPMRYPFVWAVLAYAIIDYNTGRCIFIRMNWCLRSSIAVVVIVICAISVQDAIFEYRWSAVAGTWNFKSQEQTVLEYKNLYSCWNGNPLFLYNYGRVLGVYGEYEESNMILNECTDYFHDYDIHMAMGENYRNLNDFGNAERCYKMALNMCPNRFLPMYKLMAMYDAYGQDELAKSMAQSIIEKPIKIPSEIVSQIKASAAIMMQKD